jgi:hypothetical protein
LTGVPLFGNTFSVPGPEIGCQSEPVIPTISLGPHSISRLMSDQILSQDIHTWVITRPSE